MKIQLDTGSSSRNFVHSYGPGQVTVNQQVFRRSLIVTPERVIADWPPQDVAALVAIFAYMIACAMGRVP